MSKRFVRHTIFATLGMAGIASTVAVTAPAASAAPAAGIVMRLCDHGRGYSAFIAFTTLKHTGSIAPGKCSKRRHSIQVGKLVFIQGVARGKVFQIGSYKVPHDSYEVDTFGTRGNVTFRIVHN